MGKSIADVEGEFNKRVDDVNSNLKDLAEVVFSLKSSKSDSKAIDKRIRDLEVILDASIVELRDGFQKSVDSIRKDIDRLSEEKEEGMEKDIGEVEMGFAGKIKEVESGLSKMRNNFDAAVNSLRKEIKGGERLKKDEINRIVREFFGIRAQMEERMKQLTEQFDQLDKFKEEFRKSFEDRVTGSEISAKRLGDVMSRMENQLKVISEKSFVNENKTKEIDKNFKESVKNLEDKIDYLSKSMKSFKKESSKELDELIEEAGG